MSAPSRTRRAGFTLLELMVSLTVGGIAITSIYAIGAASTRVFHQQQQVANAQTMLRIALNQLKRDFTRAGYQGTPNAGLPGQICGGAVDGTLHADATKLAAVSVFTNNRALNVGNTNTNVAPGSLTDNVGFTVDDVVLIGNFETAAEYPGVTTVGANTIAIPSRSHAFRRDFTNWYNPTPALATSQDAFNAAFAVNRLVRLRLATNLFHFSRIRGVQHPGVGTQDILITLDQPLPADCVPTAQGSWAAPISAIRYRVSNAPANALDAPRFAEATGPMAQLVREEVLPTDKNTPLNLPGARRAILDYVVAFNLSFTMSQTAILGNPDGYDIGALPHATTSRHNFEIANTVNNNPERIRAVTIDLAVRTPEQDPTFQWTAATCANLRCYRVFDDRPGAARVRRVRAEVFVPNVASEGY